MPNTDLTTNIINLLLQIPLAGVVVFVVIRFLKYLEGVNAYMERRDGEMLKFLSGQAQVNREFLSAQREQFSTGMARLAEEQKQTRLEVAELKGHVYAHTSGPVPHVRGERKNEENDG